MIHDRAQAVRLLSWNHPLRNPLIDALNRKGIRVDRVLVSDSLSGMIQTRWGMILSLELIFSQNQDQLYALFQAPSTHLFRRILDDVQTLLSTHSRML